MKKLLISINENNGVFEIMSQIPGSDYEAYKLYEHSSKSDAIDHQGKIIKAHNECEHINPSKVSRIAEAA